MSTARARAAIGSISAAFEASDKVLSKSLVSVSPGLYLIDKFLSKPSAKDTFVKDLNALNAKANASSAKAALCK